MIWLLNQQSLKRPNIITIFTIPKPFKGHEDIIQHNAISSWINFIPQSEIILFGNDFGVSDKAKEFGVTHFPDLAINKFGTPLLGDAFSLAQENAKNEILMYVNADIILFPDVIDTIKKIKLKKYLMCGRRWDLDITKKINFSNDDCLVNLKNKIKSDGKLHGYSGVDYFIFKKRSFLLPNFAVGRSGWDNWLLFNAMKICIPIINCTKSITVIHQNHSYNHLPGDKKNRRNIEEAKINFRLAGGKNNLLTIRDAHYLFVEDELVKPSWPNNLFSFLSRFVFWRFILRIKRELVV